MINFIIVEDEKYFLDTFADIVDKVMISNKLAYDKHTFSDFDSVFLRIIPARLSNKIYILDIETPSANGIDIARKIRNSGDKESIIIFITAYEQYAPQIIKDMLYILTFISKFDDYAQLLENALKEAITLFKEKKYFTFKCSTYMITIELNDILYIVANKETKKTIIHSLYGSYEIGLALNKIKEQLGDNFVYSHKSCIINKDNVIFIDKKKRAIHFKDNSIINLLSRFYKDNI